MIPRGLFLLLLALCGGTLVFAAETRRERGTVAGAATRTEATAQPFQAAAGALASAPFASTRLAESQVFRTTPDRLAVEPHSARRTAAHARTLEGYRALRAYPGAPPRVPHGLTGAELRGTLCNNCHARGGFSPRFGAYVPLTPHPELRGCLQCHPTDADVVLLPAAGDRADARCRQCHSPGARPGVGSGLDWRPAAWPQPSSEAAAGPPAIPHDLQLRGNCVACHAGPAAVAEIRTSHPERANCRQCHGESAQHTLARSDGVLP